MELIVIGASVIVLLLCIVAFIVSMSIKTDPNVEAEMKILEEQEKIKANEPLSTNQAAIAFLIVCIGVIFNVFSMPIIIIGAILLKVFRVENGFVPAYYKAVKVLFILYLIALIAFGLCVALFIGTFNH